MSGSDASNGQAKARQSVRADLVGQDFIDRIPLEFAREHLVLSQGRDADDAEAFATSGRDADALVAHNVAVRLGKRCATRIAPAEQIAAALDELAATAERSGVASQDQERQLDIEGLEEADIDALLEASERDLLATTGRGPVVKLVNALLFEALRRGASDVHVQDRGDGIVARYRVDGVLEDVRRLPSKLLIPIVSRVKVMARMDIAERRLPQDGRATVTLGNGKASGADSAEIDLRISTLPTARGERLVIRLLDKRNIGFFRLENLGMPERVRCRFERVCRLSHGMVLVTGPTGSGKTTTLYSVLRTLDTTELNVMTLEDPIEYELPGISQSQINLRKGVTFATGLRHVLRQDPDVIMVGEIRDGETARMAIQSALTGHLVFSTLHTNSAASAVTRLIDLGVEPYLINASLSAVLAQRLVRRRAGDGFRGRVGLFELLAIDRAIKELIAGKATAGQIHEAARACGMLSLREAGLNAVSRGVTAIEEVDRATLVDEVDPPDTEPAGADTVYDHDEGGVL